MLSLFGFGSYITVYLFFWYFLHAEIPRGILNFSTNLWPPLTSHTLPALSAAIFYPTKSMSKNNPFSLFLSFQFHLMKAAQSDLKSFISWPTSQTTATVLINVSGVWWNERSNERLHTGQALTSSWCHYFFLLCNNKHGIYGGSTHGFLEVQVYSRMQKDSFQEEKQLLPK